MGIWSVTDRCQLGTDGKDKVSPNQELQNPREHRLSFLQPVLETIKSFPGRLALRSRQRRQKRLHILEFALELAQRAAEFRP